MHARRQARGSSAPLEARHHERLASDDVLPLSSDRSVGLVFTAVSAAVGLMPLARGGQVRPWALAVAAGLLAVAIARPRWLYPLNRGWTALGLIASAALTSVLMALIFFGVVTPLAWMVRRLGHDLLRLELDHQATSYWLERRPPGPAPETMKNQF